MARLLEGNEARVSFVQDRYLEGMDALQIHHAAHRRGLYISTAQIERDLKYIRQKMRELRRRDLAEHADKELFYLQAIRNKAMDSFNASLEPQRSTETSRDTEVDTGQPAGGQMHQQIQALLGAGGPRTKTRTSERTRTTDSSGDPRHLQVALSASNEIRKMLGLDATEVKKIEIETRNANLISVEELTKLSPSELARLVTEETNKSQSA